MSAHRITCSAPRCPYYEDYGGQPGSGDCRKSRPVGFQPDLRRNEFWPMWVKVDGTSHWCGEHPAVRAFARQQANEETET